MLIGRPSRSTSIGPSPSHDSELLEDIFKNQTAGTLPGRDEWLQVFLLQGMPSMQSLSHTVGKFSLATIGGNDYTSCVTQYISWRRNGCEAGINFFGRVRANRENRSVYAFKAFPASSAQSSNAISDVAECWNLNHHQNEKPSKTNDPRYKSNPGCSTRSRSTRKENPSDPACRRPFDCPKRIEAGAPRRIWRH